MSQSAVSQSTQAIEVRPLTPNIGAEIRGVEVSHRLPDAVIAQIKAALYRHKVVFLRGQEHLGKEGEIRFAERLGPLAPHPTLNDTKIKGDVVVNIDSRYRPANTWHTDVSYAESYPQIELLYAVTIPPVGGDTLWASTAAAYESLPLVIRTAIDGLWALHSNRHTLSTRAYHRQTLIEAEHPVVHVHPVTGERNLLINPEAFVRFIDFDDEASRALQVLLQDHVERVEHVVRWKWQSGDLAIWDNSATQHRVIHDFGGQTRLLHRVAIANQTPVSISGRRSVRVEQAAVSG